MTTMTTMGGNQRREAVPLPHWARMCIAHVPVAGHTILLPRVAHVCVCVCVVAPLPQRCTCRLMQAILHRPVKRCCTVYDEQLLYRHCVRPPHARARARCCCCALLWKKSMHAVHASYVDLSVGEPTLDTRHLLGALGELASRQATGERVLWQLKPHVAASETDAESLVGFTPAFTPSASTPREPHSAYERAQPGGGPHSSGTKTDAAHARWADAEPAEPPAPKGSAAAGVSAALREAAQRHRGAPARRGRALCSLLPYIAAPGAAPRLAAQRARQRTGTTLRVRNDAAVRTRLAA
jgi:hypothetical protein